ncbi:MAG: DUF4142 domain-containing protein [Mucilaginibacter sp.]
MKKVFFYLAAVAIMSTAYSCQDARKGKNYNDKTLADDEAINFIKKGLEAGLTEVKAAGVAKTHSSNARIINFANMMIADHTRAGNELKKIETDKMVDDRDTISMEHQKMIAGISAKSGVEFDKAYMEMMVDDHQKAIKLFKSVGDNTSGTIQEFAAKTLPTLQMHLDSAKAINAALK